MLVTGSGLDTIEAAVQHIPANALPHTNQPTAQLNAHSDAHAGKSAPIAHDSLTQFETIWMFMDDDGARRVWRHYGADLRIVRVVYLGEAFLRHSAVGLCRAHCSLHSALCLSLCARICACTEYCEHDGVALSGHDHRLFSGEFEDCDTVWPTTTTTTEAIGCCYSGDRYKANDKGSRATDRARCDDMGCEFMVSDDPDDCTMTTTSTPSTTETVGCCYGEGVKASEKRGNKVGRSQCERNGKGGLLLWRHGQEEGDVR